MTQLIGILAGEASGDILGAGLIKALKQHYPEAQFAGIGGSLMQAEGLQSWYQMEHLSVMGLVEPFKRLPELLRMRRDCIQRFKALKPDVFIGIDSPDFNLTVELKLRQQGIKTVHYVSPSVWAWRQKRIVKIKQAADLMLTLLPFEAKFYQQHQQAVKFVGHPLADQLAMEPDVTAARNTLGISPKAEILAMLPGSRGGEVRMLGSVFLQAAELLMQHKPQLEIFVPAANKERFQQLSDLIVAASPALQNHIHLLEGQSQTVMAAADVVLMASGTASLEAMLLKKPMVVAYKMAPLSFAIISRLVKSRYISLPNLLADEPLIPELIQHELTPQSLTQAVLAQWDHGRQQALKEKFQGLHQNIRCDASASAAQAIVDLINS